MFPVGFLSLFRQVLLASCWFPGWCRFEAATSHLRKADRLTFWLPGSIHFQSWPQKVRSRSRSFHERQLLELFRLQTQKKRPVIIGMVGMELLRGNACCLVAGVGFAVNYLPVKKYDTGDGIFFCAMMSVGILMVGLMVGMSLTSTDGLTIPAFEPLAAVGGALWMLGNLMCPYIIQLIGLGLGLTMWDLSNMLMGWFIGRFGLFSIDKDEIERPGLNLIGLLLAAVSLIFFSISSVMKDPESSSEEKCRKPTTSKAEPAPSDWREGTEVDSSPDLEVGDEVELSEASKGANLWKMFLGSFLSILAGILFGTTFVLPVALQESKLGGNHSDYIMDYVFSHFIGISLTSTTALVIYVSIRRKKSYMPRQIVLPAVWSGVIWAIAQVAWFQANLDLGFSVSFPVVASLPGVIGLALGCLCFNELRGQKARLFAGLGLLLRIPGVVLIAISA